MSKGDYYHRISQPDPFPDLFEAGSVEHDAHEEARPLAPCEFPVSVTPSRRHPSGEAACERPAIAKMVFASGTDMPVCEEHLEKIRKRAKEQGDCTCTWDDDLQDPKRITADDCPVHAGTEIKEVAG